MSTSENEKTIQTRTESIIPVSTEGANELFQQPEIAAHYHSVRESDEVKKKYDEMMESVIGFCEDESLKEILKRPSTREKSEEAIKDTLLVHALEKLIKEGKGDIQGALVSVITTESLLDQIDLIHEAWEETILETKMVGKVTKMLMGFMV